VPKTLARLARLTRLIVDIASEGDGIQIGLEERRVETSKGKPQRR